MTASPIDALRRALCRGLLLVLACAPALAAAQTATPLPPALEAAVNSLAGLLSDGQALENREARRLHTVGLFSPQGQDALVLFTLENFAGGSEYHHYLAVFEAVIASEPPRYRLLASAQVGGLGWREIDFQQLHHARGRITLQARTHRKGDPACCPTRPVQVVYTLRNFNLSEERAAR